MAIVINEIELSITVSDSASGSSTGMDLSVREELIKECVEQVMDIIKNKNER